MVSWAPRDASIWLLNATSYLRFLQQTRPELAAEAFAELKRLKLEAGHSEWF